MASLNNIDFVCVDTFCSHMRWFGYFTIVQEMEQT